jgi:trk system potassium uptake protein TrkH
MNFRAIINLFSILVLLFSFSYVFPIVVSLVFNDGSLHLFLPTFVFVGALGLIGFFFTKGVQRDLSAKDGFVIIVMFWLVLSMAGSIPFYLSGMSPIDSFFESMSGITTTGATVISNIESLPESLKFYRQLLQWMGGMGLIVLAIAVMPLLGIGGGQLFKTDIPGAMGEQRLTPRIQETAKALWSIYLGLTVLCAIFYTIAGMSFFDAVSHSMSTVSIGGFSTYNNSIGHFNNLTIEIICMVFMLLSAISFALHYFSIYKSKSLKYFYDPELRFFVSILLIIFIGACSGSVGGGVKSWRVMIMLNHAYSNIVKMIHPNSVVTLKVGTKSVDDNVATSVWGFFSIYVISFVILLMAVLISGLDLETAFSAVGACLNNLGPGLGLVSENYSEVNSFAKSVLAFSMLLGRLEIFTLLIILTPLFWAK